MAYANIFLRVASRTAEANLKRFSTTYKGTMMSVMTATASAKLVTDAWKEALIPFLTGAVVALGSTAVAFYGVSAATAPFDVAIRRSAVALDEYTIASDEIGKTTFEVSERMNELGEVVKKSAASYGYSINEAMAGTVLLSKSVSTYEDALSMVEPLIKAVVGYQLSFEDATRITTTIMRTFGKPASDATDILNKLGAVTFNAKMEFSEWNVALQNAALISHLATVSFEEMAAMIGMAVDAGVKASKAGTSVMRMFSYLAPNTDDAEKRWRRLTEALDAHIPRLINDRFNMKGLAEAMTKNSELMDFYNKAIESGSEDLIDFANSTNLSSRSQDVLGAIVDSVGRRGSLAVAALAVNAAKYNELLDKQAHSYGYLDAAVAAWTTSIEGMQARLKATFVAAFINTEAGKKLAGAWDMILDAVSRLAPVLASFVFELMDQFITILPLLIKSLNTGMVVLMSLKPLLYFYLGVGVMVLEVMNRLGPALIPIVFAWIAYKHVLPIIIALQTTYTWAMTRYSAAVVEATFEEKMNAITKQLNMKISATRRTQLELEIMTVEAERNASLEAAAAHRMHTKAMIWSLPILLMVGMAAYALKEGNMALAISIAALIPLYIYANVLMDTALGKTIVRIHAKIAEAIATHALALSEWHYNHVLRISIFYYYTIIKQKILKIGATIKEALSNYSVAVSEWAANHSLKVHILYTISVIKWKIPKIIATIKETLANWASAISQWAQNFSLKVWLVYAVSYVVWVYHKIVATIELIITKIANTKITWAGIAAGFAMIAVRIKSIAVAIVATVKTWLLTGAKVSESAATWADVIANHAKLISTVVGVAISIALIGVTIYLVKVLWDYYDAQMASLGLDKDLIDQQSQYQNNLGDLTKLQNNYNNSIGAGNRNLSGYSDVFLLLTEGTDGYIYTMGTVVDTQQTMIGSTYDLQSAQTEQALNYQDMMDANIAKTDEMTASLDEMNTSLKGMDWLTSWNWGKAFEATVKFVAGPLKAPGAKEEWPVLEWIGKQTGWWEKGGIIPGTPGTPVPIVAHSGEEIVPRERVGTPSGTTITINFGEVHIHEEADLSRFAKRIGREVSRGIA